LFDEAPTSFIEKVPADKDSINKVEAIGVVEAEPDDLVAVTQNCV
jgi:hypothetical protein